MNIEERLNLIKQDYQKIEPSLSFVNHGWLELEQKLVKQPLRRSYWGFFWSWRIIPVAVTVLLIFIIFGLFKAADAAVAGDKLYPFKRLSENMIVATTKNPQIRMDHRAEEIIQLVKEKQADDKAIDSTVKEYQETIIQVQNQIQKPQKQEEFDKKLEQHQEDFQEIVKSDPQSETKLKELIQNKNSEHNSEQKEPEKDEFKSETKDEEHKD